MIKANFFVSLLFISCSALSDQKDNLFNFVKDSYPYLLNANFNVKKMEYINNYVYFCGFASDHEDNPIKTEDFIEVYDMVFLVEKNAVLNQLANFNSFSRTESIKCHLKNGLKDFLSKRIVPEHCTTIEKKDVKRKLILDVIRGTSTDKFIVKRLCSSSQMAYFCGVAQGEDGFISKTGNAINVYDVILNKKDGKWEQVKDLGKFSSSLDKINCHFGSDGVILESNVLDRASRIFSEY